MSGKCFAKAIHEIDYDLINDSVAGEEISETKRKYMNRVLSLWEQKFFEKIASSSPVDGNALSYYMKNDLLDEVAKEIIIIIYLRETEGRNLNLEKLVYEMGEYIFEFSFLLIKWKVFMKIKMLKDYITIVVNMLQSMGRLNLKNIGLSLLEKENLSYENKYLISCYLCLEYKVKEFVNKLSPDFVKKFIKKSDKDIFLLMTLWYFHCNGKKERFNTAMRKLKLKLKLNKINDIKDHVCFMVWAIKNENKVAVHYIWNKLFEEGDKKNSHKFAELAIYKSNIVFYFASKIICGDQIENFYVSYGYELLDMLANELRWQEYFMPTSEYILGYIDKMDFICTLRTLIQCWIVNDCKRESYVCYFDQFISKFNVKMNKNMLYLKEIILKVLLELENRENLNLLLDIESADDIKRKFKNGLIIPIGLELTRAKCFEIFEEFIENFLTRNEIQKFKNDFFHCAINEITLLWEKNDRDAIDEFKNKFCCNLSSNTLCN